MLTDIIKARHSIRKYTDRQITRADLELILEAGNYAPNAGGGQRSMIIGIRDKALTTKRLFYTQGDYGLFQCSEPCCKETFDNEEVVKQMYERQADMKIPTESLPKCPYCGKPLAMNLRADDKFVEDEGWNKAAERYSDFIRSRRNSRVLYLELGVGYNTPVIIKYQFWQLTAANPNAVFASVNLGEASCPQEIAAQSILIDGDIAKVLNDLKR